MKCLSLDGSEFRADAEVVRDGKLITSPTSVLGGQATAITAVKRT